MVARLMRENEIRGISPRPWWYAFTGSLRTDFVESELRRAITFRDPDTAKVIFHADRGCQYTLGQLAEVAGGNRRASVRRTHRVCWDNAQQESFWSTLKTESYQRHTFATRAETIAAVSSWSETVYNYRRRQGALGQISSVDPSSTDSPR